MPNQGFDYYSVDASIMISLKHMGPYDIFKPVWDEIARLVSDDRWKIFENVADEIYDEIVQKWLADNSATIIKFNPEINDYINKLMADLQANSIKLIDPLNLKNQADPFVIMLGLYLEKRDLNDLKKKTGDKTCCILTGEEPRENKVNIPYVCRYYDIQYMNLHKFMRYHGWHITLHVQKP
jgi:hypothetical protein